MTDVSPHSPKRLGTAGILIALTALFLASCTAQYPLNPAVEKVDRVEPYRVKLNARDRSSDTLLILAFSGGGTRAAALSYGILEALDLVEVPAPPAKEMPSTASVARTMTTGPGFFATSPRVAPLKSL